MEGVIAARTPLLQAVLETVQIATRTLLLQVCLLTRVFRRRLRRQLECKRLLLLHGGE
jgi:hypothetical protein